MTEINFKALLVGNGTFPDDPSNLPELNGPQNDIRALEDAITHPQVGLFKKDDVRVLLDNTKPEIMEATDEFFGSAKRNDLLLFYYSGHGLLDRFNDFYFCTRNTRKDKLITSAISDQVLNSMIRQSISSRVVLIIDCCHSGRFKSSTVPEHLKGEGRFVVTSSRARELAEDAKAADQMSPFTGLLVEALLSSEVDTNKDGYISINELYDFVLPRIVDQHKQRPCRNFADTYAEVPMAKSNADAPAPVVRKEEAPRRESVLAVSTTSLIIDDVEVGETLPEEIIDVFDEHGGQIDWTCECDDDWIKLEKYKGHVKLKFDPKPGMNRGRVYIRDKNTHQAKRIQVRVKVLESASPPKLHVADDPIDLGTVSKGARVSARSLKLTNLGDGDLYPRIASKDGWIETHLYGDILEISAGTDKEGKFSGVVVVESAGGGASIPVRIEVEAGPLLGVSPNPVSFLTVESGSHAEKTLRIRNKGAGSLDWTFKKKGDFFSAHRQGDEIRLELDTGNVGKFQGTVFVSSNGGEMTIPVRALVKASSQAAPQPPAGGFTDIAGQWQSSGGVGVFTGTGPAYQYQSTNVMGVVIEQGTATVAGNNVALQGYNAMFGQFSANLVVQGNMMSGTISSPMGTMPLALQRMTGSGPGFLNQITNLFG